jgi:50S ribosomal protein L16 3-hydroxylase
MPQQRFLGGLTPKEFLRRHWQKRPLFVRRAFDAVRNVVGLDEMLTLARRDDVESRIVERSRGRWETAHGPFARARPKARDWTILVSGVNLESSVAERLLRRFDFIPQARVDDLMVSYATPGGGVGPHVDSYDVFLLQGPGRRRWTIGGSPRKTFVCEPGDLLYLPPGVQHDGVALEPCFTYSVGFRAPRGAELGAAFLDWLHERGLPDAVYRDPDLAPSRRPARIPAAMIDYAGKTLARIRWSRDDVGTFLGEYLTMPKPHVVFRPRRTARRLRDSIVRLDPKTQLLYGGGRFYVNGEAVKLRSAALERLADRRWAHGAELARGPLARLIFAWQRAGYLHFESR